VLPKDTFLVQTTLCSTKLTQNEGLLSLLKWRDEPHKLKENLNIFNQKVNGKEFVKFLPDVLDALFSILTENPDSEEYDDKVFKSLIYVIHLITEDTRYQQFVPVLDVYIQENFSATLAYNKLLVVLKECVDNATLKPMDLIQAMKSLKYIFKVFNIRDR
jgi:dedicator of cytokinesis protein 1